MTQSLGWGLRCGPRTPCWVDPMPGPAEPCYKQDPTGFLNTLQESAPASALAVRQRGSPMDSAPVLQILGFLGPWTGLLLPDL